MIHFITKAKQTEKDLRTRFADDKFAEWEAQVIDALDVDFLWCAERCTQWKNLSSS